jgi:hypothetical protein
MAKIYNQKYNAEFVNKIKELINQGLTKNEITLTLKIPHSSLTYVMYINNLSFPTKRTVLTPHLSPYLEEIKSLLKPGLQIPDIAKKFNVNYRTLHYFLRKNGIHPYPLKVSLLHQEIFEKMRFYKSIGIPNVSNIVIGRELKIDYNTLKCVFRLFGGKEMFYIIVESALHDAEDEKKEDHIEKNESIEGRKEDNSENSFLLKRIENLEMQIEILTDQIKEILCRHR